MRVVCVVFGLRLLDGTVDGEGWLTVIWLCGGESFSVAVRLCGESVEVSCRHLAK